MKPDPQSDLQRVLDHVQPLITDNQLVVQPGVNKMYIGHGLLCRSLHDLSIMGAFGPNCTFQVEDNGTVRITNIEVAA